MTGRVSIFGRGNRNEQNALRKGIPRNRIKVNKRLLDASKVRMTQMVILIPILTAICVRGTVGAWKNGCTLWTRTALNQDSSALSREIRTVAVVFWQGCATSC